MRLRDDVKKRALALLGAPVVEVEVTEDMMKDLYVDAVNKFEFYQEISDKKDYFTQCKNKWIENYFQSNLKESTAHVRGKFTTISIPGKDLSLNFKELLYEVREEKKHLISLFF